jgi:SOS-response transcriptional repressor LexA|tara:strand:- start:4543 stop:4875 length:333 start_codon:yes stop_codon:yes gene_type:complete
MRERTTKKQQELLQFIGDFVEQHNYAPSYRETMRALGYKSVSTVAVHVDALIAKNYLTKTDKSARSIRVVTAADTTNNDHIKWLQTELAKREAAGNETEAETLRKALAIL